MISTKTNSLFPKQGDQNAKKTETHMDKEQGKTKHEAPRSVNYRATQNKNNSGTSSGLNYTDCPMNYPNITKSDETELHYLREHIKENMLK